MAAGKVYGSEAEVESLANNLKNTLRAIIDTNQKGTALLSQLGQTSKDKSYDTASGVVGEVGKIVMDGLEASSETAGKLKSYAEFLGRVSKS
jgi:hypothetical protein